MDVQSKLAILANAAKYDVSCASSGSGRSNPGTGLGNAYRAGICHSFTPDGRCVSLLKILFTNHCIYDCKYCVNRVSADIPRACFTPDEVVFLTTEFYKRNYIEGLFLSSGVIRNPDYTMEKLLETVRKLRQTQFHGYIHLKVISGANRQLIQQAGFFVDRLSANIELPTEPDLKLLAPQKNMDTIQNAMTQIKTRRDENIEHKKKFKHTPSYVPAGQSTQMIIGATESTDQIILNRSSSLYHEKNLKRVYYSAINPVPNQGTAIPQIDPPLLREHRLYQADWLIRLYGFGVQELDFGQDKNLDLKMDPKLAWALKHREFFPVDINTAPKGCLLRVPGLGIRNAQRILKIRKQKKLQLTDLKKLQVVIKKARYFVQTADTNPDLKWLDHPDLIYQLQPERRQLTLFG